jgi:hypothetical protein
LWVTQALPVAAVFVVVQAAALAAAVVPLWRLARTEACLRVGATSVVVLAYLLAPALHRTNLSAFHPEAIALPALLWAYLFGVRGQNVRLAAMVALVLACHGALGATVAALGALMVVAGRRRSGLITLGVGLGWAVVASVWSDATIPPGSLTPSEQFVARSVGPLAVIPDLLTDPLAQLGLLVAEPSVQFLAVVLAPVLFLPLMAPRLAAGALPCLALAIIAEASISEDVLRGVLDLSPTAAHIAPAMAFVFIALVFALERIGTRSVTRVNVDRRVVLALLFGSTLLFVAESPSSPYERPWEWGSRDAVDGARTEAADALGADDAVAVSPSATALVAERARIVELPLDPVDLTTARMRAASEVADHVLLDTTSVDPTTDDALWPRSERIRVLGTFAELGYRIDYEAQGVYLLVRPAA